MEVVKPIRGLRNKGMAQLHEAGFEQGPDRSGTKAKVDARSLPSLCFGVIAPERVACFRVRLFG